MKNKLLSIFKDKNLLNLLKKYSLNPSNNQPTLDQRFESSIRILESPRYVMSVLGIQGSGKSTLLNTIFFQDIVLPTDADETTCIPTEICYSNNDLPQSEIIYKDGRIEKIDCSQDTLRLFVHQKENPSNIKAVDRIIIKLSHPLLKSGLVFVDLPGIGSITPDNVQTTMNYIKESSGAIFLILTVPPITDSEAIFIQGALPLITNPFFVQNQWIDESRTEVEDGCEYNEGVIREIGKKCGVIIENLKIHIVGIQQAFVAVLKGNVDKLQETGLQKLTEVLQNFSEDWPQQILNQTKNALVEIIIRSLIEIKYRIKMVLKNSSDRINELNSVRKEFERVLKDKKALASDCIDFIKKEEIKIKKIIDETCRIASENFRNAVREIINSGVTGGTHLNQAFNDIQKDQLDYIFSEVQPNIIRMSNEVILLLKDIDKFDFNRIDIQHTPDFEKQTDIHSIYVPIASSAAGIGGMIAGAEIGTLIFPGAGTLVGAAFGFVGGLLAGLLGSKIGKVAQEFHLDKQKEFARSQLFKLIKKFYENTNELYTNGLREYCDKLETKVKDWIKLKEKDFNEREKSINHDASNSDLEKQRLLEEFKVDEYTLESLKAELIS